ncbi:MAG TPA: hypothetical protein VGL81_12510 [Polyangiaceae bacterium]|jgi:hypothetical protein
MMLGSYGAARAADPRADLEQAEQAFVNLDYDGANKGAARIVQMHGLTHEQLVRAYRVLALTDAVLDKQSAARDAFEQILTFDPTYQGDPNLGPKVQGPFMEARGFMRAQPSQPGLEVSVVLRPTEPGTIRVTTRDPTHAGKRVVVGYRWGGRGAYQTAALAVGEGERADIPPPAVGTTRLDYYVQMLDANDSVALESGNPAMPRSATVEVAPPPPVRPRAATEPERHSVFGSPVFWTIAGVLVAGAATATYVIAHKSTTSAGAGSSGPPTGAVLTPALVCGGQRCN